jgi:hypothetical protein
MNIATEVNKEVLGQIAAESIAKISPDAKNAKRWINAITKAVVELENNPYCSFDTETHSLLICSSKSGATYEANGTCQCEAFKQGQPCFHRAAARIVAIAVERMNQPKPLEPEFAEIYALKNISNRVEKIGNVRI